MEDKHVQEDEFATQYYQISAPAVIQYLYNGISSVIKQFFDSMEEQFGLSYPQRKAICYSVFNNLFREYINNTADIMEQREQKLRELLTVPSHMLSQDKCQLKEYSEENLKNLKDEIADLESLYIKKKAFTHICKEELKILEQLEPLSEKINDIISSLHSMHKPENTKFENLLEKHDKNTNTVMEELFSDTAELKFKDCNYDFKDCILTGMEKVSK